jgi:hypothetical protein
LGVKCKTTRIVVSYSSRAVVSSRIQDKAARIGETDIDDVLGIQNEPSGIRKSGLVAVGISECLYGGEATGNQMRECGATPPRARQSS